MFVGSKVPAMKLSILSYNEAFILSSSLCGYREVLSVTASLTSGLTALWVNLIGGFFGTTTIGSDGLIGTFIWTWLG